MVTAVDRKRLWGRSGSRCALCNSPLTELDGADSIVGDEAHIRARAPGGPRYDPAIADRIDSYDNLILLCKAHHKLVDDNPEIFTPAVLNQAKRRHETRVTAMLDDRRGWTVQPTLELVRDGSQLMGWLSGSSASSSRHDHPRTSDEAEAVATFLQDAQDYLDISGDIGPEGRVHGARGLHDELERLWSLGWTVRGGVGSYRLVPDLEVPTVVLEVVRSSDSGDESPTTGGA